MNWGDAATAQAHRWKGIGRWARRLAVAVLGVAVGGVLLYAFENWRAERAWERYKSSLVAQGQQFDPAAFIPSPVPDDQNFLKAPVLKDWFVPPHSPPGTLPVGRVLRIPRPGDDRLLGWWGECRPTDLTEWRDCYRRVRHRASSDTDEPPDAHASDRIQPIIAIDDVPLYLAIMNLARHAGCNFLFDSGVIDVAQGGRPMGHVHTSFRFENVTPREALEALLDNYGLALVKTPHPPLLRVTKALAPTPEWLDEPLDLETASLPAGVEERVPLIIIDQVPVIDAVRNIARQARLNLQFEPEINPGSFSNCYSLRLTNATLREALSRALNDNGLGLKEPEPGSIYRVVRPKTLPRSAEARQYYSAAAVLASFDSFDEELGALYAACDRPQARLDVNIPRGFGPGLVGVNFRFYHQVAQALALHASAHLALSDPPAALRDATALFRFTESLRHQPELLAVMLQTALTEQYLQVMWEGLAGGRWKAGQLEILEGQLQSMDLMAACRLGLEAEQAVLNQWLEQTPRPQLSEQLAQSMTGWSLWGRAKSPWAVALEWNIRWCPRGWIRQAQMGYTEAFQDRLAMLDVQHQRVFPAGGGTSSDLRPPAAAWVSPVVDWFHRNGLCYVHAEQRSVRSQTCVNLARVACALERYRLAHGRFPDRLSELRPNFLKRLPHDPMNGRPFQYGLTEDGQFVLYSVGWDGADNRGGTADWVWRYPAK